MSPTQVVVIVLVVLVIAAGAALAVNAARRRALRQRFGPEYDRMVAERDSRSAAEKELRARERRHAELTLTPLSPESRARYTADWEEIQLRFVDTPAEAVGDADELITRLIAERGYPTGDFDEQAAHLSVEHARTLSRYREAHDIHLRNERGEASTEELRQAVVHFRALVADLLGADPVSTGSDGAAMTDRRSDGTGTANHRAVDTGTTDRRSGDTGPATEPVGARQTGAEPVGATPSAERHTETTHDATSR